MKELLRTVLRYPVQIGAAAVLTASIAGLIVLRQHDHEKVREWWNTATNIVPSLLQAGKEDDAWQLYEKTWEEVNALRITFYKEGIVEQEEIDRLEDVFNRSYLSTHYKPTNAEPSLSEHLHEFMWKPRAPSPR